jgi:hypothetical protein
MKIDLVSFALHNDPYSVLERTDHAVEIINKSSADIILFPGYTLYSPKEMKKLLNAWKNSQAMVLFEVGDNTPRYHDRFYTIVKNGIKLKDNSSQQFVDSGEVNTNKQLMSHFITVLNKERQFDLLNNHILLLICGELNFLKNEQGKGNKVSIRTDDPDLNMDYLSLIKKTNVFLNPQHTPMGNQGKLKKRREYLSSNNKCYCSTTNLVTEKVNIDDIPGKFKKNILQYCYFDGMPVAGKIIDVNESYLHKQYLINF